MVLNADLSHLHEDFRATALLPDEQRIDWIRSDRYLGYRKAARVVMRLSEIHDYPQRARMPCVLIYGASGMGKTKILEKFARDHGVAAGKRGSRSCQPIVTMQMPTVPEEAEFLKEILMASGAPFKHDLNVSGLRAVVRRLLADIQVRVLVIDELQNMLAGTARQQRIIFNTIRFLTNELKRPICCAGTEDARAALIADPHLADRFEAHHLLPWRNDDEFVELLTAFEHTLPLRRRSDLRSAKVRHHILDETAGITVRIFRLVENVAIDAIRGGEERVDLAGFQSTDLAVPLVSMVSGVRQAAAR
jgi:hypothetical protein